MFARPVGDDEARTRNQRSPVPSQRPSTPTVPVLDANAGTDLPTEPAYELPPSAPVQSRTAGAACESPPPPTRIAGGSPRGAVAEIDHSVAEAAFVEEFELQARVVGKGLFAASHDDRREEQVALVDQAGPERVGGELRTAHGDVPRR